MSTKHGWGARSEHSKKAKGKKKNDHEEDVKPWNVSKLRSDPRPGSREKQDDNNINEITEGLARREQIR